MPPLGLLTVASMIPDEYDLRLCDMNVEALTHEMLSWADAVFISAMIVQKESLMDMIARITAYDLPIIAGGPYSSTAYADLPDVDHFIIGEAEGVLPYFFHDFEQGNAKRAYARVYRSQEEEKLTAFFDDDIYILDVNGLTDMTLSPEPQFNLLPNKDWYQSMAIQLSRGCPIGCEFCDIWRRFGQKTRYKSFQQIEMELNQLYHAGWRGLMFIVDDNFIGNKRQVIELLHRLIAWQMDHDYPFVFFTEVTLNLGDQPEIMALMQRAGFDYVFIGIETPSVKSLLETGKKINTTGRMQDKVAAIQSHGMQVSAGFIIGFDNDPDDIAIRMIDAIHELGIPMAMVGLLQALPDTDLADRLAAEGRLLSSSDGNNTHQFALNFMPARPINQVIGDYKAVLQSIYSKNLKSYFSRCKVLRKRFQINPYIKQSLKWVHIKAIGKFLIKASLKRYAWQCGRFLIGTAVRKPSFISTALKLAMQGHHFRDITRLAFEMECLQERFSNHMCGLMTTIKCDFEKACANGEHRLDQMKQYVESYQFELPKSIQRKMQRLARYYDISIQDMSKDMQQRFHEALNDLVDQVQGLHRCVPQITQ